MVMSKETWLGLIWWANLSSSSSMMTSSIDAAFSLSASSLSALEPRKVAFDSQTVEVPYIILAALDYEVVIFLASGVILGELLARAMVRLSCF